jgi:hypothetical protein
VPSTVADIFAAARTSPSGVVPWGTPIPSARASGTRTGLYVVALTETLCGTSGALPNAPIADGALGQLLGVRPELRLNRRRPSRKELGARLAGFWFPDEVVVYIGLAGPRKTVSADGEVAHRVSEYYKTALGARSPHAGGWPLKVLACLDDLHVHFGYCHDVDAAEKRAIGHFADHVSTDTRAGLHDPARVMPFANLEFPKGRRKDHGITGACAPRRTKTP